MPGHHHRSGSLKQQNKKNKRSKSSKRSLSRAAGGKINGRAHNGQKAAFAQSKADRRNKLQQKRDAKRAEILQQKRGISGSVPPRVIGIIGLGNSTLIEEKVRLAILEGADRTEKTLPENSDAAIGAKFDVHKKDGSLTVLTNSTAFANHYQECNEQDAAVQSALDLCRICDMILFVLDADASKVDELQIPMQIGGDDNASAKSSKSQRQSWDHIISEQGDSILHAVKAQGLPSILTVLAHTETDEQDADFMSVKSTKSVRRAQTKRSINLKKYASRFASTEFGPNNDTVMEVNISHLYETKDDMEEKDASQPTKRMDVASLVRALCTKAAKPPKWVAESPRPYILSDWHQYDTSKQELRVSGYIRGKVPFCVNSLVHVPNLGTYACKSIEKKEHPFSRRKDAMDSSAAAVVVSDPSERESLEMFATPDALEGEQNLVGFDEDDDDMEGAEESNEQPKFSRPAGWSDYQSAWLDAVDGLGAEEGALDQGELADELNKKSSSASVAADGMDLDEANDITAEEKRLLQEQRKKEQAEHQDFPDEVDVDEDDKARDRFARYRSLKSFRKTYWDPKENLPESYASIFHFASFKATQRSVLQDMTDVANEAAEMEGQFGFTSSAQNKEDAEMEGTSDDDEDLLKGCVPSGSYVTMTLEGVTPEAMKLVSTESLLVAVALLAHENKASVLHAGLSQTAGCTHDEELPIKSKDVLTFRCGWRTWKAKPVFSQNNLNCNKHKFERFMPTNGAFFAATFFGPVTYTPCPVLVFRQQKEKSTQLCATGSMIGADADRIVVKRIILTGYPVRVHKRHATVKYMFHNPEDVKWFKPAGLWTKHGLNGHIIESVGEHGTMKVLFNAPIKQHDTVCLPLYKRIFPKLADESPIGTSDSSVKHSQRGTKPMLTVR